MQEKAAQTEALLKTLQQNLPQQQQQRRVRREIDLIQIFECDVVVVVVRVHDLLIYFSLRVLCSRSRSRSRSRESSRTRLY